MTDGNANYAVNAERSIATGQLAGRFGQVLFVLWLAVCLASAFLYQWSIAPIAITCCVFTAIAGLTLRGFGPDFPHQRIGLCNIVTASRAGLVALIAGAIALPSALETIAWPLIILALVAFAMDGLDGWLARRSHTSSAFGARFDMEVDALLGAVLALLLLTNGVVGLQVVLLGFMRYGFVAAAVIWPWLNDPLPESLRRKTICVLQIAVLIILMLPLNTGVAQAIALAGAAALTWSFAVDTIWLKRHRS